eukprot:gene1014-605_t
MSDSGDPDPAALAGPPDLVPAAETGDRLSPPPGARNKDRDLTSAASLDSKTNDAAALKPSPAAAVGAGVPQVGLSGPGGRGGIEHPCVAAPRRQSGEVHHDPAAPVDVSSVPLPPRRHSDPPAAAAAAAGPPHLPPRAKEVTAPKVKKVKATDEALGGVEEGTKPSLEAARAVSSSGPGESARPDVGSSSYHKGQGRRDLAGEATAGPSASTALPQATAAASTTARAAATNLAPLVAEAVSRWPAPPSRLEQDAALAVYTRPLRTLTCHVKPLYTLLRERMVETKRYGTPGVKYNSGFDDHEGHYRAIIGETILQRYVVTGKLGSGSFGKVLRCYDEKRGINVALKITRTGRTFREQAKLEVNVVLAMNRLAGVNQLAVRLLKVFDWMGHMVLSFEMLSNNLFQALKMTDFKGLSLDFIRDIAHQILLVLQAMGNHQPHAIIHSDLKPENIVLRFSGSHRVTLIDFGSACYAGHCIHKYIQSRFYRSPEVILHLPYDTAIDRWSLGCMLVELHTGVPLFGGRDEKEQVALFEATLGPIPVDMLQKSIKARKFYTYSDDRYSLMEPCSKKRTLQAIIAERHGRHAAKPEDPAAYSAFLHLVTRLLAYRPSDRISCSDALKHPFFSEPTDPDTPHLNPKKIDFYFYFDYFCVFFASPRSSSLGTHTPQTETTRAKESRNVKRLLHYLVQRKKKEEEEKRRNIIRENERGTRTERYEGSPSGLIVPGFSNFVPVRLLIPLERNRQKTGPKLSIYQRPKQNTAAYYLVLHLDLEKNSFAALQSSESEREKERDNQQPTNRKNGTSYIEGTDRLARAMQWPIEGHTQQKTTTTTKNTHTKNTTEQRMKRNACIRLEDTLQRKVVRQRFLLRSNYIYIYIYIYIYFIVSLFQPAGLARHNRKKEDDEEFEHLLSDLRMVTKKVGVEKLKENQKKEKKKQEKVQAHQNVLSMMDHKKSSVEEDLIRRQQQLHFQQLLQQLMQTQRSFLDKPNTNFHSDVRSSKHFDVAVGDMQGWRAAMEDEHVVDLTFPCSSSDSEEGLFCVFDGHSGTGSAQLCSALIPTVARQHRNGNKVNFVDTFLEVDDKLKLALKDGSGCTAVVVHVTPKMITCASVGDSRAVLCRGGEAVALSHDHKPENDEERERIEAAGGFVQDNRVNGQLAMSRAMGDFTYKGKTELDRTAQPVIAVPDIIEYQRDPARDAFIAVACDGIFDVLSNEELVEMILKLKGEGMTNVQVCEAICHQCLAPSDAAGKPSRPQGTDNMTIMVVDLK